MRLGVFAALALLASFARPGRSAPEAETAAGPVLLVSHAETLDEAHARIALPIDPRPLADEERATALALAVLLPAEIARLDEALDALNRRLEVRQNPLVEDLSEGEPTDALVQLVIGDAPALAAAYAITSRRVVAGDKRTVVAVARSCDEAGAPSAAVRCIPAWAPSVDRGRSSSAAAPTPDPDARRARFFAWSVAMSATIAFDDDASLARARDALRAASTRPDGTIALVASAADLVPREDARAAAIREKARRALSLMGDEQAERAKLLRVMAHDPIPGASVAPWLALGPRDLLVVPRLAAVARIDELAKEIERESERESERVAPAAGGRFHFVHRPTPL